MIISDSLLLPLVAIVIPNLTLQPSTLRTRSSPAVNAMPLSIKSARTERNQQEIGRKLLGSAKAAYWALKPMGLYTYLTNPPCYTNLSTPQTEVILLTNRNRIHHTSQ